MTVPYDPYLSKWENQIEAARLRENELLMIEVDYPPPPEPEEENDGT